MIFRPFYRYETGCASYYLGCAGKGAAAIVDPLEEYVDDYIRFAELKGTRIGLVVDTHVHADHRSGAAALVAKAGATYAMHASAPLHTTFRALADGDLLEVGNVLLTVLHTPGHTPEGISLLVADRTRGPEPWFVLTGDTLFVGSVGRPDLPDNPEQDALQLHASVHRLLALAPELEIYPAHFSGSVCGKGMSGKPSSTIAFERRTNSLLSLDKPAFVASLLGASGAKPADMESILAWNKGTPHK